MHIAFATPEYYIAGRSSGGGLGVYIRKAAAELVNRGHEVEVFVLSNRNVSWPDGQVSIREIAFLRPPHMLGRLRLISDAIVFLWERLMLRQIILAVHRQHPFDLIQVSSYKAPGLFLPYRNPAMVCRLSSIQRLWREAYGGKSGLYDHFLEFCEGVQSRRAAAVFSPSAHIAAKANTEYGIKPLVIPTMPDHSPVLEDDSFFKEHLWGKNYLLYFGQLSRIKGIDLIASVLPEIFTDHPSIEMVCIGRDDGLPTGRSCRDYLFGLLPARHRTRLHFFPPLPKEQLYPCIRESFGVIFPSRIDNLPNACLETLFIGVPLIASAPSSMEEIVQDGKTGFLFGNGDTSALHKAITKLLCMDESERRAMIKEQKLWAQAYMKQDKVAQLERFYQDITST